MQTNQFEQAFSDFLDRHEYDQAENALFSMVRIAFRPDGRRRVAKHRHPKNFSIWYIRM